MKDGVAEYSWKEREMSKEPPSMEQLRTKTLDPLGAICELGGPSMISMFSFGGNNQLIIILFTQIQNK